MYGETVLTVGWELPNTPWQRLVRLRACLKAAHRRASWVSDETATFARLREQWEALQEELDAEELAMQPARRRAA